MYLEYFAEDVISLDSVTSGDDFIILRMLYNPFSKSNRNPQAYLYP